jgi:hypothetical protein
VDLTRERDSLRLKNEILIESMKKNNIYVDTSGESSGMEKLALIEEYS